MTTKKYKVWQNKKGFYHRYYGPCYCFFNTNTQVVAGKWFLHGDQVK